MGKAQKLEMARDKWATPENLETHYRILTEVLIKTGLAVANPLFDPDVPWDAVNPNDILCQPCKLKTEGLSCLFSFDETEARTDQLLGSKLVASGLKQERTFKGKGWDKGVAGQQNEPAGINLQRLQRSRLLNSPLHYLQLLPRLIMVASRSSQHSCSS
jgi:hypothetical protein